MLSNKQLAIGLLVSSFALVAAIVGEPVRPSPAAIKIGDGALDLAASAKSCSYSDQSGGVGGQSGRCEFVCDRLTSVSVTADDGDATVSGDAKCDGVTGPSCTGDQSCGDTEKTAPGGGICSGDTDEAVDSGFSMGCSSEPDDVEPPSGEVPEQLCPVSLEPSPPYPRVCINTDTLTTQSSHGAQPRLGLDPCLMIVPSANATLCDAALDPDARIDVQIAVEEQFLSTFTGKEGASSAHIFADRGAVGALVCWGYDCWQVMPDVSTAPDGRVRMSA